jgi:hypothetical protein
MTLSIQDITFTSVSNSLTINTASTIMTGNLSVAGKIGIGTTPNYFLDVNGGARITDPSLNTNAIISFPDNKTFSATTVSDNLTQLSGATCYNYYPFDYNAQNYATINGVTDATFVGSCRLTNAFNRIGTGSIINDTSLNSYFKISNGIPTNVNGYTFSYSLYLTSSNDGMIMSFNNTLNSATNRLYMIVKSSNIKIATTTAEISSNYIVSTNTWYNIVWTLDTSSNSTLYVNGTSVFTTATIPYINNSLGIGLLFGDAAGPATYPGVLGYMEEFRYYDGVLTPAQVTQIYNYPNNISTVTRPSIGPSKQGIWLNYNNTNNYSYIQSEISGNYAPLQINPYGGSLIIGSNVYNTAIGLNALTGKTSNSNTAIGYNAGYYSSLSLGGNLLFPSAPTSVSSQTNQNCYCISRDGTKMLLNLYSNVLYYATTPFSSFSNITVAGASLINNMAMNQTGSRSLITTGTNPDVIRLVEWTAAAPTVRTIGDPTQRGYYGIDINADGTRFVVGAQNVAGYYVYLSNWNTAINNFDKLTYVDTGNLIYTYVGQDTYSAVAISPDGTRCAFSGSSTKTLYVGIYNQISNCYTLTNLGTTSYYVRKMRFSPDGNYLIFSSNVGGLYYTAWNGTSYNMVNSIVTISIPSMPSIPNSGDIFSLNTVGTSGSTTFNLWFGGYTTGGASTPFYNAVVSISGGLLAGTMNYDSSACSYLGTNSGTNGYGFSNSTAIGYGAQINTNNQIVLGTNSETITIPGKISVNTNSSLNATNNVVNPPLSFGSQLATSFTGITSVYVNGMAISKDGTKVFISNYTGTNSQFLSTISVNNGTHKNWSFSALTTGGWTTSANLYYGVALNGNGSRGAYSVVNGRIYYFTWTATTPSAPVAIADTSRTYIDVDMTSDGNRIIACAYVSDKVYISNWNGASYGAFSYADGTATGATIPTSGYYGCAITGDGARIAFLDKPSGLLYYGIANGSYYTIRSPVSVPVNLCIRTRFSPDGNYLFFAVNSGTYGVGYYTWNGTSYGNLTTISTSIIPSGANISYALAIDGYASNSSFGVYAGGGNSTAGYKTVATIPSTAPIDVKLDVNGIIRTQRPMVYLRDTIGGYSGTSLTLSWNLPYINRYNMWSSANPTRITVPVSGAYKISLCSHTYNGGSTAAYVQTFTYTKNGDASKSYGNIMNCYTGGGVNGDFCTHFEYIAILTAGDYINLYITSSAAAGPGGNYLGSWNWVYMVLEEPF